METEIKLLVGFKGAADLLSISRTLLYEMHADGRLGPRVHKLGKRSLLNRQELSDWVHADMPPRRLWDWGVK